MPAKKVQAAKDWMLLMTGMAGTLSIRMWRDEGDWP
jgi:hypothetical protein